MDHHSCHQYRLVLHLDHINGKKFDHRLENLRFLCPNCHSQTPTYCGKHSKKERISDEDILKTATTCKSVSEVLQKLNRSGAGSYVRYKKLLDKYFYPELFSNPVEKDKEWIDKISLANRRTDRPDKRTLIIDLKEGSFLSVGRKYGVSDNAIRKWCKRYGISSHAKDYK